MFCSIIFTLTKDADDEHLINGDSNDVPSKDGDDTSPSKNEHKKEDFIIPEGNLC